MADSKRPMSPHLQVYSPQMSSMVSILNRVTGVALAGGALLLTWWLVAAATGPASYEHVSAFMSHWFGRVVLFGFTWALMFHMLGGLRHLYWDTGRGMDKENIVPSSWMIIILSVALTIAAWAAGYSQMMGGM
jgi:succinate dehydrogenase / fumarate reductase cytochrome b subunit